MAADYVYVIAKFYFAAYFDIFEHFVYLLIFIERRMHLDTYISVLILMLRER